MKSVFLVFFLMFSQVVKAETGYTYVSNTSLQNQHDWDHLGVSFAVQTIGYGFAKKAFKMDTLDAYIFSFISTLFITTLYSLGSYGPNGPLLTGHDVGMNMIGTGASIGTCLMFNF